MIAVHDSLVAHLGGWRGDQLSLRRAGDTFTVLQDLGWNASLQATPQRRLHLTDDALFVLEPGDGLEFRNDLRVRRFDFDGNEKGTETGLVDGGAGLAFRAEPHASAGPGWRVTRFGIANGRPTRWEGRHDWPLARTTRPFSGSPVPAGEGYWYPVRNEGLFRGGELIGRGAPAAAVVLAGRVVCAAVGGVWIDGNWLRVEGLSPPRRAPHSIAAAWTGEGHVFLHAAGGVQPGTPPGHLPPGAYSDLVTLPDGAWAVAAENPPRLVRVAF